MKKPLIIWVSIIAIILALVFNSISEDMAIPKVIAMILAFGTWIANVFIVYKDAKDINISTGYAGLALILGGLGGLIYVAIASDVRTRHHRSSNWHNAKIFNIILTIVFTLAFLLTMPWFKNSTINWSVSGFMLVLVILSLLTLAYTVKKSKE